MNVGRVQTVMQRTIVELPDMPFDWWISSELDGVIFCGEFNQMMYQLSIAANRIAARATLQGQLVDMARRVGVEYTPTQRYSTGASAVTDERN